MKCPRCHVALREAEPGQSPCAECEGVWVDGARVGDSFPALHDHARRIDELIDAGAKRGSGIERCPHCNATTLEFPFLHVWLDLCPSCYGVWLDGPELAVVAAVDEDVDGVPDPVQPDRAYRGALPTKRRVECIRCHAEVHPARTLLTGDGALCEDCVDLDEKSKALRNVPATGRVGSALRAILGGLSRLLDADGRRNSFSRLLR